MPEAQESGDISTGRTQNSALCSLRDKGGLQGCKRVESVHQYHRNDSYRHREHRAGRNRKQKSSAQRTNLSAVRRTDVRCTRTAGSLNCYRFGGIGFPPNLLKTLPAETRVTTRTRPQRPLTYWITVKNAIIAKRFVCS